jgi:glutathione S-transferase
VLVFYHGPGSSSMAVHIALHEVGAPFDGRIISFTNRDQDPPEFRTLNPEGKVPALVIDGRPLTEVAGILYYLARRYPEASLFPFGDIEAEAQVISWMSFIASTLHPARRQGPGHAHAVYRLADQRLADPRWAKSRSGAPPSEVPRLRAGPIRSPISTCSVCSGGSGGRSGPSPRCSRA